MYENDYAAGSSVALYSQQPSLGEYAHGSSVAEYGQYGRGLAGFFDVITAPFTKVIFPAVGGAVEGFVTTGNPIGAGAAAVGAVIGTNTGGAVAGDALDITEQQLGIIGQLRRLAEQAAAGAIMEAREYAAPLIDTETDRRVKERAREAAGQALDFGQAAVPLVVGGLLILSMMRTKGLRGRR